jgi:outer membrane protein assembly factor BamA
MMYRATLVVERQHLRSDDPAKRATITTRVGGCVDEDDARAKLRKLYFVVSFKKVEPVQEGE